MSINMSYCQFHNTRLALMQCSENWDNPASDAEKKEREKLLKLMKSIVADYADEDEQ